MTVTLEDLHEVFRVSAVKFSKTQKTLSEYEKATENAIADLIKEASQYPFRTAVPEDSHPLCGILKSIQDALSCSVSKWRKDVSSYEKNTALRKRHEDSLLIYVYGQVKSGKSALGNFIIYGKTDPDEEIVSRLPGVTAFMETDSGEMNITKEQFEKLKKFKVDFVEATSAIQGLCLEGLTWLDSPGIHSMTRKNGNLAKDYMDSADLVLFISTSQSPCTMSEVKEIRAIKEKKKSFLFVIPKMDFVDMDEDESGTIISHRRMLSDKDREDARQWTIEHLHEQCTLEQSWLDKNVITISCLVAEQDPTIEGWQKSGMAALVDRIAQVAHEDGFHLKQVAPLMRLVDYNNQVLRSIEPLQKQAEQLLADINRFKDDARTSAKDASLSARIAIRQNVTDAVHRHTTNTKEIVCELQKTIPGIVDSAGAELLQGVCKAGQKLVARLQVGSLNLQELTFPDVKEIERSFSYRSRTGERLGTGGGAAAGAAMGAYLGSAVPVVGTALGALGGAVVGSFLGKLFGSSFDDDVSKSVVVGDTRDDVVDKISVLIFEKLESILSEYRDGIIVEYTNVSLQWIVGLQNCISRISKTLQEQNDAIEARGGVTNE